MTVRQSIVSKLAALAPLHLEVVDESHRHDVPPGSESHFKVVVVSERFEGQRKLARHRMVYGLVAEQLAGPVHALALHTYTGAEWARCGERPPGSPDCLGGGRGGPAS